MPQEKLSLDQAIDRAYGRILRVVDYGEDLWRASTGAMKPRPHQILRIHEAVQNGSLRIMCNDGTSAGKTFTAAAISGLLDKARREQGVAGRSRVLLFAPNQALHSAWTQAEWDKYCYHLGLPQKRVGVMGPESLDDLARCDVVEVNFDKLSMTDPSVDLNRYQKAVYDMLPAVDIIIVDECHNLKNLLANRTRAFIDIVERTKDKRFIMLTATAFPNRLRDVGFLLYMFNPVKYKHYASQPFDYASDPYSLRNAMNSGAWFTFSRDDVIDLFGLRPPVFGVPDLGAGQPHRFELPPDKIRPYFEVWRERGSISKIHDLSQILLEATIPEISRLTGEILAREPRAQVSVFSFYVDPFSDRMAQELERHFPGRVSLVTGEIASVEDRIRIAERFTAGDLRALVCSSAVASESIRLITRDRPAYVFFAQPPIDPKTYDQIIGRHIREGQAAPVHFIEMVPASGVLNGLMCEEKRAQELQGRRFRRTWRPATIFEDRYQARQEKFAAQEQIMHGLPVSDILGILNASDDQPLDPAVLPSLPGTQKPESEAGLNHLFNTNLKRVRAHIGRSVEGLVQSDEFEYLLASYSMEELLKTSAGDTNRAIAQVIAGLEAGAGLGLARILDWGCGTAVLARVLERPVVNFDMSDDMLRVGKVYCDRIESELSERFAGRSNAFIVGNALRMPFRPAQFDLVSSSYALQYNAQGTKFKRDVERILLETNRVLVPGGFGVFALPNQATTQETLTNLSERLLPMYGFRVLLSDFVTGLGRNEETGRTNQVFPGCYLVVYQKAAEQVDFIDGGGDIFVYPPYKEVGAGGLRERRVGPRDSRRPSKRAKYEATEFRTSGDRRLGDVIKDIASRYQGGPPP